MALTPEVIKANESLATLTDATVGSNLYFVSK